MSIVDFVRAIWVMNAFSSSETWYRASRINTTIYCLQWTWAWYMCDGGLIQLWELLQGFQSPDGELLLTYSGVRACYTSSSQLRELIQGFSSRHDGLLLTTSWHRACYTRSSQLWEFIQTVWVTRWHDGLLLTYSGLCACYMSGGGLAQLWELIQGFQNQHDDLLIIYSGLRTCCTRSSQLWELIQRVLYVWWWPSQGLTVDTGIPEPRRRSIAYLQWTLCLLYEWWWPPQALRVDTGLPESIRWAGCLVWSGSAISSHTCHAEDYRRSMTRYHPPGRACSESPDLNNAKPQNLIISIYKISILELNWIFKM